MGKRHKGSNRFIRFKEHKKKAKHQDDLNSYFEAQYQKEIAYECLHESHQYSINCHSAKWVNVGLSQVYVAGWYDIDIESLKEIRTLDLFIGLVDNFDSMLPSSHIGNSFVQTFYRMIDGVTLKNLAIYPVRDYGIDKKLAETVIDLFKQGVKIGFGCMAGHGRTGWLLGSLIRAIEGLQGDELKKAIRERLCQKALEGKTQFEDLGITPETIVFNHAWGNYRHDSGNVINEVVTIGNLIDAEQKNAVTIQDHTDKDTHSPSGQVSKVRQTCLYCQGVGFKDGYLCPFCDGEGIETVYST